MTKGKVVSEIPADKIYVGMNVVMEDRGFTEGHVIGKIEYINRWHNKTYVAITWDNNKLAPLFDSTDYLNYMYYCER